MTTVAACITDCMTAFIIAVTACMTAVTAYLRFMQSGFSHSTAFPASMYILASPRWLGLMAPM